MAQHQYKNSTARSAQYSTTNQLPRERMGQNHNIPFLRCKQSHRKLIRDGSGSDLGERVEGELGDGEELVLGDEALGAAVELAEALVQGHDLLLRDCSSKKPSASFKEKKHYQSPNQTIQQ